MVDVRSWAAPEWEGYDGLTGNNSSVRRACWSAKRMLLCSENAIARIQFLLSLLEKKLQNPPTEIAYY